MSEDTGFRLVNKLFKVTLIVGVIDDNVDEAEIQRRTVETLMSTDNALTEYQRDGIVVLVEEIK